MKLLLDLGKDISIDEILRLAPGSCIDLGKKRGFMIRADGRMLAVVAPVIKGGGLSALRVEMIMSLLWIEKEFSPRSIRKRNCMRNFILPVRLWIQPNTPITKTKERK